MYDQSDDCHGQKGLKNTNLDTREKGLLTCWGLRDGVE